jgi:hypothetical protein
MDEEVVAANEEAKRPRVKGAINSRYAAGLDVATQLIAVARRAEYTEKLTARGIDTAFLATLEADITTCYGHFSSASSSSVAKTGATQSEASHKESILILLQEIQSAALQKTAGRKERESEIKGYYIGTALAVQDRANLIQIAHNIADTLEKDTLPGIPTTRPAELRVAFTAWTNADSTQGAAGTTAKDKRKEATTLLETITDRRIQIQFAADGAWPARIKSNANIRTDFQLPKTRPLRVRR